MKFNYLSMAAVSMLLGSALAGCSSDSILNDEPQIVDRDTDFYINVAIANPEGNSTRADDPNGINGNYTPGEGDENKINEILFIFYNSDLNYVGNYTYTYKEADGIPGNEGTKPGTIETVINITVPVSVSAGSLKPAYVMAYVNPAKGHNDRQSSFANTLKLTRKLTEVTPQEYKADTDTEAAILEHKGYTMTNSVYYAANAAAGDQPVIAVSIDPDKQLCSSKDEADTAVLPEENTGDVKKKEKVVIYVERVVAKVRVTQNETVTAVNNKIKDAQGNEYTLNFQILGWGLSNLEKETFLLKNFRTGSTNYPSSDNAPLVNMTWSAAQSAFTSLTNPSWNFPSATVDANHPTENWSISGRRSFWAMSPTYFPGAVYPSLADEITVDKKNCALDYLSFNDIYNSEANNGAGGIGAEGKAIGANNYIYTLEHTMQPAVVTNEQKRGVTCALIVGKYSFTNAAGTETKDVTFYIRNGVNTNDQPVSVFYAGSDALKKAYLSYNNVIYTKSTQDGKDVYTAVNGDNAATLDNFILLHCSDKDIVGNYDPSRFVTLQLKTLPTAAADKYYMKTGTDTFLEIISGATAGEGQATLKDVNKALYSCFSGPMGGVSEYEGGLAYFSVPIEHLWTQESGIGDAGFSAKLGQYGIVRNHVYTINITDINGIGTGIGEPQAPIIPIVDNEKYHIRAEIRVQKWRIVPTQDATLKP